MFKVVLVDDEPFVIEGLVEMVAWDKYGFKVSGMASDGESALELIKTVQPDVVFTDIRMPGMDGLRLIDETRKLVDKEVLFVILSGYSEFDYIKKAMDLKSFTYLLKPIDSDAVNDELTKIRTILENKAVMSERFDESVDVVLGMTFERLCSGQMKPTLIGRAQFLMDFKQDDGYVLGVTSDNECIKGFGENDKVQHMFFRIAEKDRYFVMWGSKKDLDEKLIYIEDCCNERQDKSFVYTTAIQTSLSKVEECYQIIESHQRLRFYEQPTYKMVLDEVMFSKEIDRISKNPIFNYVSKPDRSEIDYQLSVMFHELREKRMSPELLKLKFEVFVDWIQIKLHQNYGYEEFVNFKQFKEVCKDAVIYYYNHLSESTNNDVVIQIRNYAINHMNEDLKLKTVAKLFGYNSVYLGQIFQKDMDIKYKDFITRLRIDKAKELLLYSSLRVKDVANEVGFNNPDYFVKKFKECEGVSPSEYRL